MSPIRPKAVDGVVVHHPRTTKTNAVRRPRRVELSETLIREQEDIYTTETTYDTDGEISGVTQNFITRLKSHYQETSFSDVGPLHVLVATLAGIFLITYLGYKGNAEIMLYPKEYTKSIAVPASAFEQKEMTISESLSQKVETTSFSEVSEKATGTVTLVNEEMTVQKFRAATRLESADGKIYFMENKEVVVPAKIGDKPGTLDVLVVAEKPGPEYNIEKTDFVVPGWRETKSPKFTTQYAHTKTPISGGFIGKKPSLDSVEQSRIIATLKQNLEKRIKERASREIPEMWFTLAGGQINYNEPKFKVISDAQSEIILEGQATYSIANRVDIGSFVAKQEQKLAEYSVIAKDTDQLVFDGKQLTGTVVVQPLVPEALYKQQLLGKKIGTVKTIFEKLPEVSGMEIKMKPFWKRTLPSDPSKITIKS